MFMNISNRQSVYIDEWTLYTVYKRTIKITKQVQYSVGIHVLTLYLSKAFEIHLSNSLKCIFFTLVNATVDIWKLSDSG